MDLKQDVSFFSAASKIEGQDCSRELNMNAFDLMLPNVNWMQIEVWALETTLHHCCQCVVYEF